MCGSHSRSVNPSLKLQQQICYKEYIRADEKKWIFLFIFVLHDLVKSTSYIFQKYLKISHYLFTQDVYKYFMMFKQSDH